MGARNPNITQEYLKTRLHYDPETGVFVWLKCRFISLIGQPAGNYTKGYITINLNYTGCLAHRLAWLYMTGEWPPKDKEVDHINRVRDDNRWCNLRLASGRENSCNNTKRKNTLHKYKGVCLMKDTRKKPWEAYIRKDNKKKHLGYFYTEEGAAYAYNKAAQEIYGEFACLNTILIG